MNEKEKFEETPYTDATAVPGAETGQADNDWLDPDAGSEQKADQRSLEGLRNEPDAAEINT